MRGDVELAAQVAQQHGRHGSNAVERPSAHAREANVQRQAQLEAVAAAPRDQLSLVAAEAEERLQLELAELVRQVTQAEVRRLPALHCRDPSQFRGRKRYRAAK
jgi:hypothetical protein